jgi:hypothetical protein
LDERSAETPDAVPSADFAFDQPLKGRSELAGKDKSLDGSVSPT